MTPAPPAARDAWRWAAMAASLYAATLALFWPGYALYDSVQQFGQATSGRFDDWHPPLMAWLWRQLHLIVGGGAAPMLAVQLGLWWLGFGLIAAALARRGCGPAWASGAVLAVGLLPPALGWQAGVLKDAQMVGALLAATGLVAWWRLRGRSMPWLARLLVAVLLIEATLLRANAIFAVAPFVAALADPASCRLRAAIAAVLVVIALSVAGPVNHGVFGAARSGVERTQAIYDLAGIAARLPTAANTGLTVAEREAVIAKACVSPYFWDPLGDEDRCGDDLARLSQLSPAALYATLATAVLHHPLAYAGQRLAHLNSTDRWLVPFGWPGAAVPAGEPNTLGLRDPGAAAARGEAFAGRVAETPLGWPVTWVAVALAVLAATWRRPRDDIRSLAVALAVSALALEASFAVVSIASDLRYHLWPMVASALAAVLTLADGAPRSRTAIAALLACVVVTGGVARAVLPRGPQSYAEMIAWRAGR